MVGWAHEVIGMLAVSFALLLVTQTSLLSVGQPAPVLTLPSGLDGSPLSLKDFRGKKVMLHIWASW